MAEQVGQYLDMGAEGKSPVITKNNTEGSNVIQKGPYLPKTNVLC